MRDLENNLQNSFNGTKRELTFGKRTENKKP